HGALNYPLFDVYVKGRGEPIEEEEFPRTVAVYRLMSDLIKLDAGSYDIYLTDRATKTVLAGPYQIDLALGDVVELLAVDTVDPTVLELTDVPVP
ncbi:MAG: hypothetical protein GWP62_11335, partial [Gammaproteobacteria bacterium]|nr:hypothetical protein [Gammaproteobacteria bacterium]